MSRLRCGAAMGALAALLSAGSTAAAQSAVETPANVAHAWLGAPGTLQFNLLHRFSLGDAPGRKLTNAPTLTVATGLTGWLTAQASYASNSSLVSGVPNEWEFGLRSAAWRQEHGAWIDVYGQVSYNVAARSEDANLLLARRVGAFRLLAHGSAFSHAFDSAATRTAVGGGVVWRFGKNAALAWDATTLLNRRRDETIAWSGSVQMAVPYTPHSLSLHVTNVNARTLEGIARGTPTTRVGFEYTIPITLRRYVHPKVAAVTAPVVSGPLSSRAASITLAGSIVRHVAATDATLPSADTVHVDIKGLRFSRERLEVSTGTTIVWHNRDPLVHTVTDDQGKFNSGEIMPSKTFSFTFASPGTFGYHCTPHPFMKAQVVVMSGRPSLGSRGAE